MAEQDIPPDAVDRALAILRAQLDAALMARGWAYMAAQYGRFEGTGESSARRVADDVVVEVPLHFEAGDAKGIVRFDRDGRIGGLAIRPASS
jgi:hypothetical protein